MLLGGYRGAGVENSCSGGCWWA